MRVLYLFILELSSLFNNCVCFVSFEFEIVVQMLWQLVAIHSIPNTINILKKKLQNVVVLRLIQKCASISDRIKFKAI